MLVVTAVPAERDAIRSGLSTQDIIVEAGGVGPAIAAASTAWLLATAEAAGDPYSVVVCAGIAGGFPGRAEPGSVVLGRRAIAADLGAQSSDGFIPVEELGFGTSTVECDSEAFGLLRRRLPAAVEGDILTVSTVTGTAQRAAELSGRHPAAVAEGMEGYGVGIAAVLAEVAFIEIRAIANPVGPRDRGAWRIAEALAALTSAAAALEPAVRGLASTA